MTISISRLLIGQPVANREADAIKLGVFSGVPAIGLDALASAAYGPEAALSILAVTGAVGLTAIEPITWIILVLLAILCFSYWQTVAAYPSSGGAYIVAKTNLGSHAGLLAAAALMVDYTLNVAVAISAGVGALTSAVPALHGSTLWLCLAILGLLTVTNLRGMRDAGLLWSLPTYVFVLCLGVTLIWGVVIVTAAGGHPHPAIAPPRLVPAPQPLTMWLLLRAFASGCTAMTGVEAVSNSVSAFHEPSVKRARGTLATIVVMLGLLLLGVAHLARAYGIGAMDQSKPDYRSVLSQLISAVSGQGVFYYVTIAGVLAVLCLSANTSFVGFPRVCRLVARDGFLPEAFALPGRRLVYSVGILFLAAGSGALLVAFGGITDRLIPLFAIGAFLSFTLSQAGMAVHWWQERRGADGQARGGLWRSAGFAKLAINGGGALATGLVLIVILVAKFAEGAWLTVIVIPCILLLLKFVRHHHDQIDRQLLSGRGQALELAARARPVALVPVRRWDRVSRKAIRFALAMADNVTAVHVTSLEGPEATKEASKLRRRWRAYVKRPAGTAGRRPPRLLCTKSEYRSILVPLLKGIEDINTNFPGRPVIVVLPELVEAHWWEYLMHTHRERRLRARLLRYGGEAVSVVSVPWQLEPVQPAEGVAEEEAKPAEAPAGSDAVE